MKNQDFINKLRNSGLRPTKQRIKICEALFNTEKTFHFTVNDLAKRARAGQLKPDEIQGGTITMTNVGSFGNLMGTPIINQPQVAIMACGIIKKKPVVLETEYGDVIAIRHMMFLSLSYDHRVVDGALGGQFVRKVADYLENFDKDQII